MGESKTSTAQLSRSSTHHLQGTIIFLLSRTRLIFNHQKAPLRCLNQLHTDFQLIPVSGLPCRLVNRSTFFTGIIAYNYKVFLSYRPRKLVRIFAFDSPTHTYAKFQLDRSMHSRVRVVFVFVRKEEKNEEQKLKLCSLVSLVRFASFLECSLPL